jgi:hypothetical protein
MDRFAMPRIGSWVGGSGYTFERGYPTMETAQKAYDDADLNRGIQAYRFFYPTVSGAGICKSNSAVGLVDNQTFGLINSKPCSDTPYGRIQLDLRAGPFVIEVPAGPLIVAAVDVNRRWVGDMGLPGPDHGRGGKHLLLPPGYQGPVPPGHHVWRSTTYRVLVGVRSLPLDADVQRAIDLIRAIKVRPLLLRAGWTAPKWVNLTDSAQDATPLKWEAKLEFWKVLHEVIDTEPPFERYRDYYGELAVLGIVKGRPFSPDMRMRRILETAAKLGNALMRVQSFADRRPDRVVWKDRRWEWVGLRPESGDFDAGTYVDLDARELWFYQAIGASPAMIRRNVGSGSVFWLGLRDRWGAYLDGGKSYRLLVPLPVPAKLFWSVTVYDAETRTEIETDQGRAALRSLFELKGQNGTGALELRFGPMALEHEDNHYIKTIPHKGWFAYFRIYGPEAAAFDGSWKPGDFEEMM